MSSPWLGTVKTGGNKRREYEKIEEVLKELEKRKSRNEKKIFSSLHEVALDIERRITRYTDKFQESVTAES